MRGLIFVNPFGIPESGVAQANELREEFEKLGVKTEIVSDGFLKNGVKSDGIDCGFSADFAVFLDKDKYLSYCLEKSGVRLFNRHDAIRVCDDKAKTCIALAGKGVNIPDTVFAPVCYSEKSVIPDGFLTGIAEKTGFPVVVKECYGSGGKGVYLARDFAELKNLSEKLKLTPHVYQRYMGKRKGTDVRLIVIGGKTAATMLRENKNDFRSNIALGGVGKVADIPRSFYSVAEKCAKILDLDYCGVDILYGDNDEPFVAEVNSNAFWGEITAVTGINVAKIYAEHIIRTVKGI
ncbi:MAG: RimK family alpha-L-glutamate ligase [Clostridia bacterium]|nr:RimK family alpha-L-glutamate ligase [Clostridia bacterium]